MNKRKIIWQHWQNPFGGDEEEFVNEEAAKIRTPWEDEEEEKEVKIRPVVPTPMGFMPIYPFQSFSKSFEFWLGHTNFDITPGVKDKIEATEGVEILDVITRYCFRVAVGKAFTGADVKISIQRALNAMPPRQGEINPYDIKLDKDTEQKVSLLRKSLADTFEFWAIYVLPNGEIDVTGANTQDGHAMHVELYQQAQELAGGVIYQYS